MKFVMYSQKGFPENVRPGLIHGEGIVDLEYFLNRAGIIAGAITTLRQLIELGETAITTIFEKRKLLDEIPTSGHVPLIEVNLKAPLSNTKKFILVAGNYIEHIREVGYMIPPSPESISPQFFMKPPSTTILDPEAEIRLPDNAIWFDWEVELAVVIGKGGKNIAEEKAMEHVFGYTIVNDISERKFNSDMPDRFTREKDPLFDWLHGKWFDGSAPMGPCIATKDLVPDPHDINISLEHNGTIQQDGSTSDMIHTVPFLIHKLSQIMTLEPGDVLSTGTPSGVGFSKGMKLQSGDELICRIEKIGVLRNTIR